MPGAGDASEFPVSIDLMTVICACGAATSPPTRETAADPMAAIDSATASQPSAIPAT